MRFTLLASAFLLVIPEALAANPASIQQGQQLFTQPFNPTPPGPNGDGLGPLFNHVSCVACHHSGGVGGAGDHRFNARSVAISRLHFSPKQSTPALDQMIRAINPLLLGPSGELINAVPIHRHGGSPQYAQLRNSLISRFNPTWDDEQRVNSDSVRAEAAAHLMGDSSGMLRMQTHIFARNTTALFGAGLIDRVPDSLILQHAQAQRRYADVSGRPATLADGRIGKFGWRANFATLLEFNENACVNELGLQSRNVPQTADPTDPAYRNPKPDIDDKVVRAMTDFVASLPAPTRAKPTDSYHRQQVMLGEQRFSAVGCAVCHVPDLGPAKGIYSDLLLHDMGRSSVDYSTAPPYRKDYDLDYEEVIFTNSGYYGTPAPIIEPTLANGIRREFIFESPQRPEKSVTEPVRLGREDDRVTVEGPAVFRKIVVPAGRVLQLQRVMVSKTIPTNITQEWRTPPLWGLKDSAPYLHDGRAETILEAIAMHDGEATRTRNQFFSLPYEEQLAVIAFLESLVAPTQGVIPAPKDFTDRHFASR